MTDAATLHERPTRVRYLIVAAATVMAFLLYLDRFCVSILSDYMRQDLGVTQEDISRMFTAFFLSYALAQVPSGWLSDRFGARGMLAFYILAWSAFTALTGAVTGLALLLVMRFACGFSQAGAYPTAASVVGRWVPITARGSASAIVANGGRIGGALAPVLTAWLIVLVVPADTPVELRPEDILDADGIVERLAPDGDLYWLQDQLDSSQTVSDTRTNDEITANLNQLLNLPDLYNPTHMDQIKLPREGMSFLKRHLASDAREPLSETERGRFHRFILESQFNKEIAKLYGRGWRPIMYIYGLIGIPVAALFWFLFRERPSSHPWSNDAEAELVNRGRGEAVSSSSDQLGGAPVIPLLKSGNMWCCCISQWGTNIGWLFIMTWLPRYLMDVHQVPLIERGVMTMIPAMIGIIGMFLGGKLTDILADRLGVKWGRRVPIASSRMTALLAYVGCILVSTLPADHSLNSPWTFTALLSIVAFSTDFGSAPTWAFNQDIGGRHIGSVLGWGNMWGNLGATVAPWIYNRMLGENPTLTDWNMMFGVCAASFGLSFICAMIIDASKPIVPEEE